MTVAVYEIYLVRSRPLGAGIRRRDAAVGIGAAPSRRADTMAPNISISWDEDIGLAPLSLFLATPIEQNTL